MQYVKSSSNVWHIAHYDIGRDVIVVSCNKRGRMYLNAPTLTMREPEANGVICSKCLKLLKSKNKNGGVK